MRAETHFTVLIFISDVNFMNNYYTYVRCSHRHLCANCLENVVASKSHNPMGLHVLLQG
jgi:hypothetical protein